MSVWSYILVDPNLLLLNKEWWVDLQTWFWRGRENWQLVGLQYAALVGMWWGVYLAGAKSLSKGGTSRSALMLAAGSLALAGLLWLGHNALSHDIFNYLFNAKMVAEYGVDPHIRTALEFSQDPWLRFMHNVHTSAPYGYGWTVLSLIPFVAGLGKFLLAYLAMKAWMILGLALYLFVGWRLLQRTDLADKLSRFWLFVFNPVLLWETALNGHNDVWMMWPALAACAVVLSRARLGVKIVLGTLLMALSISVKLVTVVLVPVLLFMLIWPYLRISLKKASPLLFVIGAHGYQFWAEYASLALLVPLVTARSQQFLPWYLIWAWGFFPLIRWNWLRWLLLIFAFTSQMRYLPWLLNSLEYSDLLQVQMRAITWSAVVGTVIVWIFSQRSRWLPKSR